MVVTPTTSIPFTDLDKQRFNAWFEHDARLPDLANELDTTVLDLAEWARQPHVAEALDAVSTVARQRHATLRAEAQHAATARLLRIVRYCDHDEIARRAADRLLRSLPTGERPLDSDPKQPQSSTNHKNTHRTSDKDVHVSPSTPQPRTLNPIPPLRISPILHPASSPAAHDSLRATAPASPSFPAPSSELMDDEATSPQTLEEIAAAVLDEAARTGIEPEDLDDPHVVEDILDDLNLSDRVDFDDLQDAIDDAHLDREAANFESAHGIPITHPAIRAAIADFRIDEIPTIAATLRANAPP